MALNYTVNYLAVLVATVAAFVFGWLFYGPLFGKKWMKLSGMKSSSKDKQGMGKKMVIHFITMFVFAYTLAVFIGSTASLAVAGGTAVALVVAIGFIAMNDVGGMLWKKDSWNLYLLNQVYTILALVIMGAIIGAWA